LDITINLLYDNKKNIFFCKFLFFWRNTFFRQKAKTEINLKTLLKEYSYCKCLQSLYPNDLLFKNDISFTVYQEISDYAIMGEDAKKLDSISFEYAESIKPSDIPDYNLGK
jgi:hypothetical protein